MAVGDLLKAERIIKIPWYQKGLALALISAVIFVLYYFTLDRSYRNQISQLNAELTKLQKSITELMAVKESLQVFETQNKKLKKELEEAMTKLPTKTQIDELLKDITVRARTNGIEVTTFERKPDQPQTLYVEVPVKMKLKSNFFAMMIFLNELARMERIVNLTNLQLQRGKEKGMLEASFTLLAYRFKEESAVVEEKGKPKKK